MSNRQQDRGPTFVWYFDEVFLQKSGANLADQTLKKYRRIVSAFVQFCGGPLPMLDISDQLLTDFHTRLLRDAMAKRTAQEARSIIAKIMRDWRPEWPLLIDESAEQTSGQPAKQRTAYTLMGFFERIYLPERLKDKRPSYRQKMSNTVTRFIAFCRGDISIDSLTPELLKRYKDWFIDTNRGAPSTALGDVYRLRVIAVAAGRVDMRAARMKRVAPQLELGGEQMDIEAFYRDVFRQRRSLSAGYDCQIQLTLRNLRHFLKRPPMLGELPSVMNAWVQKMELTLSAPTIKRRRAAIITLWNFAAECRLCEPPNTRLIRAVKTTRPTPDAFTMEQMQALLEACGAFRNTFYKNGINRGRFWEAFIRVCYDTALRRGDMLTLRRQQISVVDGEAYVTTVQGKTGDGIVKRLRPKTVASLDAIFPPDRELIFDYPHNLDTFSDHWDDVLARANIDPTDRRNGVQKLRRTSASYLERVHPGAATAHLGHRSADMAQKHYLDPKISRAQLPLPPELDCSQAGAKGGVA
jgi:integrase